MGHSSSFTTTGDVGAVSEVFVPSSEEEEEEEEATKNCDVERGATSSGVRPWGLFICLSPVQDEKY
jgi:hypothetical protein